MVSTKKIISTLVGLIVIAILIYTLLSVTGILRNSDPNNQKLNESMNAIDNQAMTTIGADSSGNTNVTSTEERGFGYWFKVGAGVGLGFVVGVGGVILLIFIGRELWEEYGPADVGI